MADNSANPRRNMEGDGSNVARLRESVNETGREPSRTTPPAAEAAPARLESSTRVQSRRRRIRPILLLLGPVLLVLAGLYLYLSGGRYVSTDNAYVKADKLSITTDVPGFVAEINVKDNQKVERNQVLLRLDDEPFRIALTAAQAQLGVTRNEIEALQAKYRQNLAQIEQAQADLAYSEAQFQRQQTLIKQQATSPLSSRPAAISKRRGSALPYRKEKPKQHSPNLAARLRTVLRTIHDISKLSHRLIRLHVIFGGRCCGLPQQESLRMSIMFNAGVIWRPLNRPLILSL